MNTYIYCCLFAFVLLAFAFAFFLKKDTHTHLPTSAETCELLSRSNNTKRSCRIVRLLMLVEHRLTAFSARRWHFFLHQHADVKCTATNTIINTLNTHTTRARATDHLCASIVRLLQHGPQCNGAPLFSTLTQLGLVVVGVRASDGRQTLHLPCLPR
jgi:hypothetical protein